MTHHCHAAACDRTTKPSMFMCLPHWRSLPYGYKLAVNANYRGGQEDDWKITRDYADAVKAAIRLVADREGITGEPLEHALAVYDWLAPEHIEQGTLDIDGPP